MAEKEGSVSETWKGPEIGPRPEWAKALIVAEYETDESDLMTDYFATATRATVPLAWSRHARDLFPEMRKAAAKFEPTAHLGPGKGVFTARVVLSVDVPFEKANGGGYYKGTPSHWHGEKRTFDTRAAAEAFVAAEGKPHDLCFGDFVATFEWEIAEKSIEHREKYSMGGGYYLKASGAYSTGWTVSKRTYRLDELVAKAASGTAVATLEGADRGAVPPDGEEA